MHGLSDGPSLKLHTRLGSLEKKFKSLPKPVTHSDFHLLKNNVAKFENKMGSVTNQLRSSVSEIDKKADRAGTIKIMPKGEAVSLASDMGTIDARIKKLANEIALIRSEMPHTSHILAEVGERMKETSGAMITRQQHSMIEINRKLEMIESRVAGSEKDLEEEVEKMRKQSGESELPRFLNELADSKKRITKLEEMANEFDALKKRSESFNAQELKDSVFREFERINESLVQSIEKKKDDINRMETETVQMREGIESLRGLEDKIKGMDSEGISRDLEILKTKTKWLEEQIEGINISPLHDRIEELETDIRRIVGNSPLIVE